MKLRLTAVALALVTGVAAFVLLVDGHDAVQSEAIAEYPGNDQPTRSDQGSVAVSESLQRNGEIPNSVAIRDWTRRFHESKDDFLLAQELADAAVTGDAKANYVLGEVLLRCELHRRTLMPYTEGTVAERVEFHLASGNLPDYARNKFRREALSCERLFAEDPFEARGLSEEARDFRYWSRRAVEVGDPVAVMNRSVQVALDRRPTGTAEEDRALREAVLGDVRHAVFSGDATALLMVGGLFSNPSIVTEPDQGYAWIVAACELGYDCSNANPALGTACVDMGTCVPGHTLLDTMQRDFTAAKYAAIYANAQDIQYKIRTNDWDGLQQYLQIKD